MCLANYGSVSNHSLLRSRERETAVAGRFPNARSLPDILLGKRAGKGHQASLFGRFASMVCSLCRSKELLPYGGHIVRLAAFPLGGFPSIAALRLLLSAFAQWTGKHAERNAHCRPGAFLQGNLGQNLRSLRLSQYGVARVRQHSLHIGQDSSCSGAATHLLPCSHSFFAVCMPQSSLSL